MGVKDQLLKRLFMVKEASCSLIGAANYGDGSVIDPESMRFSNPEHISLGIDDAKNGKRKKNKSVTCDLWLEHEKWNVDYGLELQSYVDYSMSFRLLNEYGTVFTQAKHTQPDGTADEKLSKFGKNEKLRKSVITVGFFGTEGPWDAKEKLSDYWHETDAPEEKNPLDFTPTVFDPWQKSDEELMNLNMMREVEMLCIGVRYSHDKKALYEKVVTNPRHDNLNEDLVAIVLHYLNVCDNEDRVKAVYLKGGRSMCKAAEELHEDWKEEGRAEGRTEGRTEERKDMKDKFASLMSAGKSSEEIFATLFK